MTPATPAYADAVLRLLNHANAPTADATGPAERESIEWVMWRADEERRPPDLGPLVADVLACLDAVNRHVNGPVPTARAGPTGVVVPPEVAYAVAGIVAQGLRYHRRWSRAGTFGPGVCRALEDGVYRIAHAGWQLLAGDVDDLSEGIDLD